MTALAAVRKNVLVIANAAKTEILLVAVSQKTHQAAANNLSMCEEREF